MNKRIMLSTSPASNPEIVSVLLTEEKFPLAFERKVSELKAQGLGEHEVNLFMQASIYLELIYEPNRGLFAVESDAIPSGVHSPYTKEKVEEDMT